MNEGESRMWRKPLTMDGCGGGGGGGIYNLSGTGDKFD